jgi:hypothetical protein
MISSVKTLSYRISRVRIDNGTVLLCKDFTKVCETEAITMERTVPYSHLQLGRFKRQWRTLVDGAKTLLLVPKLPERFWRHAFLTMIYIKNRRWSFGSKRTPMELVTGRLPNLGNLRVFECPGYVHIVVSLRRKFSNKA